MVRFNFLFSFSLKILIFTFKFRFLFFLYLDFFKCSFLLAVKVALDFLERKSAKTPCAGDFDLGFSFLFIELSLKKAPQRTFSAVKIWIALHSLPALRATRHHMEKI